MNIFKKTIVLIALISLSACSTLKSSDDIDTQISKDPFEGLNRKIYVFNDTADRAVLRPVAKGYNKVIPKPARKGVSNFFSNLGEPLNIANNLLQGKYQRALSSTYRFTVNSTIGLLGLFDVAKHYDVEEAPEDLGQTLAVWGVKPGPYILLPFLGPTNLRDGFGRGVSGAAFYPNSALTNSSKTATALTLVDLINTRAGLMSLNGTIDAQIDPYSFIKSASEQNRINRIYDGSPPEKEDVDYDF